MTFRAFEDYFLCDYCGVEGAKVDGYRKDNGMVKVEVNFHVFIFILSVLL